jgi:AraC family transcriptional regulator of adaptative response / DNA-3-methyladenine glycosylase II
VSGAGGLRAGFAQGHATALSEIRERAVLASGHHRGVDEFESRYLAVASRDRRFEGRFLVAVTSTGVYCRVGCPSRTPGRDRVRFFATPAAAEAAGFRACRRCRPEADGVPGSALVGQALHLIAGGGVDGPGVGGAARRLGVSSRTLHRRLTASLGTSARPIAGSRRVQTARTLITETSLPLTEVAFAAGFNSLRRFNEVMRAELGVSPGTLRGPRAPSSPPVPAPAEGGAPWLTLRLSVREPYEPAPLLAFLAARTVASVDSGGPDTYARSLRTLRGSAVVELRPAAGHVSLRVRLDHVADLEEVVRRCRRLLDLDTDPAAVGAVLGADPLLAPLVASHPGLRVPGAAEPFELAVRAVLGQQVSVAAARTLARRLVARHGEALARPAGPITHLFPAAARLAEADLGGLGLTGGRVTAVRALSRAVAEGLDLEAGDPGEIDASLATLPGFGPWTRAYVAMRARGDPDALPVSDLGLRRALERLGAAAGARSVAARAERWRPWRAYACAHLWSSLATTLETSP